MSQHFQTHTPIDGSVLFTRDYATTEEIDTTLQTAKECFQAWKSTPLAERIVHLHRFVEAVVSKQTVLATELTQQMGRPIRYSAGEIGGFKQRAVAMLELAPSALADLVPPTQEGFTRFVKREPLGVVLVLSPWNYPYLTAVNAIIPALAAGNTVVLKHSEQTALVAERLQEAAVSSGLPEGVFQTLHATHEQVADMVADARVNFIAFTGSVGGGHAVQQAAANRFVGAGLELGGKDPAYVRADANFEHAVENLVDGAFFNSGQSCCGIERIYVHESLFERFVERFVELTKGYVLGDPMNPETTLGPMVRSSNADHARQHIAAAVAEGATALIDPTHFANHQDQGPYLAPQVLINVTHEMAVMREETFAPVVGIMSVASDEEAIQMMNDSDFGLTASIWTINEKEARQIAEQVDTGTVFMNRCDYLDPQLAWVGIKNSGRGCTLSAIGFEHLTRPKSFHFRQV